MTNGVQREYFKLFPISKISSEVFYLFFAISTRCEFCGGGNEIGIYSADI